MAAKLNQIIAVVNGKKTRSQKALTEIYHKLQKSALFEGITRTYKPLDEDGETFPEEKKNVQFRVADALREAERTVTDLLDATATQDYANCGAKADVVIDERTILSGVPVTHLLLLEKQLTELHTFVGKIPTLDPAERWQWNAEADCYASQAYFTNKTKKVPRSHLLAEATEKHPAQVEMYHEDVKVGEWQTTKFSGAIPAEERNRMLERVEKLQEAVKFAREEANNIEVQPVKNGKKLFDYVFRGGAGRG
jgi:hypothetical protein